VNGRMPTPALSLFLVSCSAASTTSGGKMPVHHPCPVLSCVFSFLSHFILFLLFSRICIVIRQCSRTTSSDSLVGIGLFWSER
jgi:hypothetical protein